MKQLESVEDQEEETETTQPMATTDKELEEQLLEAGNKLADPPSSVEELLSLLDVISHLFPLKVI